MLIEEKFPAAVGAKLPLASAFLIHASAVGISEHRAAALLRLIPSPLSDAECFFDKISNIWKYEFGEALRLSQGVLLGTAWEPVRNLVAVIDAVERFLSDDQRRRYLARLARQAEHDIALCEFMPVVRLAPAVACDFEFRTGKGNRDVDWRVQKPGCRPVLIDVKHRISDLIAMAEVTLTGERKPNGHAPQPRHEAAMLFRSVAQKFQKTSAVVQLQGAWVSTALKQETTELHRAFDDLDPQLVHFAIIGGWERGVLVLTRHHEDEAVLLDVFNEESRRDGWEFVRA